MTHDRTTYRAYLLRVWRTPEVHWRASLEDPHTGERRAFATLAQLVAYLEREGDSQTGQVARPETPEGGGKNGD
jgi:hypothetical protein